MFLARIHIWTGIKSRNLIELYIAHGMIIISKNLRLILVVYK